PSFFAAASIFARRSGPLSSKGAWAKAAPAVNASAAASNSRRVRTSVLVVVEVLFVMPRHEAAALRGGLRRARDDALLEQQVHEHDHRLGLEHERARRLHRVRI